VQIKENDNTNVFSENLRQLTCFAAGRRAAERRASAAPLLQSIDISYPPPTYSSKPAARCGS